MKLIVGNRRARAPVPRTAGDANSRSWYALTLKSNGQRWRSQAHQVRCRRVCVHISSLYYEFATDQRVVA